MNFKYALTAFFFMGISILGLKAQKLHITLPQEANKKYAFILNKGIEQDTIQQGKIFFLGDVVINIPDKDKGYAGMGALLIEGGTALNLVVNNESFEVKQGEDKGFVFKNSPENEYLYAAIRGESFPIQDSTMYALGFINAIRYMMTLNKVIQQGTTDLAEKVNVRLYALNELDIDRLYTSGFWYNVIDGLTKLTGDQQLFGEDMIRILKRVKSQEVFEHLANNIITITDQYGWDDAFDIIIPYIEQSGRIEVPQGKIYAAFSLIKVRKGTPAPPIEGLNAPLGKDSASKTLIVFYQPDCENCHIQMEQLLKEYAKFERQHIRIVTISADHDEKSFEEDVKRFPWDDKLCDFKGFAGRNFLNYGIMGVPTFFLLDENQKIIKRYAKISDIIAYIELNN